MRSPARSFDRELWRQQSDRARGRSNFLVRSIIYFRRMSSILAQIGKHENNRTLPTVMLYCLMLTCFDLVGDTWQLRIAPLYGPPPSWSTRWWKARFTNFNEKTIMQPCTWRLSSLYWDLRRHLSQLKWFRLVHSVECGSIMANPIVQAPVVGSTSGYSFRSLCSQWFNKQ